VLALCALCTLGACTEFPDLDNTVSDRALGAEFPDLVPAETLSERARGGQIAPGDGEALLERGDRLRERRPRIVPGEGEAFLARANRLRARGQILRDLPTIDEATRKRISSQLRSLGG
jgi:hypothetical protein